MKCLTIKQASKEFFKGAVSISFLYKEVREGKIPHVKLSKGKILLDSDCLEKWWNEKLMSSIAE